MNWSEPEAGAYPLRSSAFPSPLLLDHEGLVDWPDSTLMPCLIHHLAWTFTPFSLSVSVCRQTPYALYSIFDIGVCVAPAAGRVLSQVSAPSYLFEAGQSCLISLERGERDSRYLKYHIIMPIAFMEYSTGYGSKLCSATPALGR